MSAQTLLAAPFVGEIGWELLSWQGRVRHVFRHGSYERLIVLGAPGRQVFYHDMPLDYREINLTALPGWAYENRRYDPQLQQPISRESIESAVMPIVQSVLEECQKNSTEVDVLSPGYDGSIWPCDEQHQDFIRFPANHILPSHFDPSPHVVLVQRTRSVGLSNWTQPQWDELAERLRSAGVRVSLWPVGWEETMQLLSQCDLAVGQSTGGLHLASLCGCPHVVWSVDDSRLWTPWAMTNRQRYETLWNPLGTPVRYHACPQLPTPRQAAEWTMQGLWHIGRRYGSATARTHQRLRWQFRRCLHRQVIQRSWFQHCPWPVQKFLRYQCL